MKRDISSTRITVSLSCSLSDAISASANSRELILPIELLPDTELPQLSVSAEWGRASPEAMEAFVTAPLEAAVQQVRGVEEISSVSSERYGQAEAEVTVQFERDTDMDFARLELSERIAAILAKA